MKQLLRIAVLVGLGACTALAQQPPTDGSGRRGGPGGFGGPPGRGQHPPFMLLMAALDANTNHVIEATEIANATAALATLDKNGDGQLTMDELMPPRPGATNQVGRVAGPKNQRPPGPPIIKALDVNADGVIDTTEIANAGAALLKLDANGDGQLTPDELRPQFASRPGGPGGPEGEPPMDGPPPAENQ